jgi:hypothetical protein
MRIGALVAFALTCATVACGSTFGGTNLFRQYEYEEDVYLSLDGSATVYVNGSLAALNALRGTSFDASPTARFDREAIRAFYSTPNTHVAQVSQSRRSGRRFAHVRLDVDDIRRLGSAPPFAWSTYNFERDGGQFVFRQELDGAAGKEIGTPGWTGREMVAFRLHLPSIIDYHNTNRAIGRGNILVWEQSFADRRRGVPMTLEARMRTQSILYSTLWLFGATFVVVATLFVGIIWWVLQRGRGME